jgi:hypothetical protein
MARKTVGPSPVDVASWMTRLRTALFENVSEDDIAEIARSLVAKAKAGDLAATRLLMSYVMGGAGMNIKQAVIVQGQPMSPLPAAPTVSLPHTPEKLDVMARRAAAGQPLCDPRDKLYREA